MQRNTTGVCGECSQWMDHTGFAPAQGSMYFLGPQCSGFRVLCKGTVPSGPAFHALLRPKLLGFLGAPQGHRPRWAVCFVPFPNLAAQVTRCLVSALFQVVHASYSPPRSRPLSFLGVPQEHSPACAACFLWGADLRLCHSWQMSTVQDSRKTRLANGSLFKVWWKMWCLGLDCSRPLPSTSGCHKPASLPPGRAGPVWQPACSPLVFAQSSVL